MSSTHRTISGSKVFGHGSRGLTVEPVGYAVVSISLKSYQTDLIASAPILFVRETRTRIKYSLCVYEALLLM